MHGTPIPPQIRCRCNTRTHHTLVPPLLLLQVDVDMADSGRSPLGIGQQLLMLGSPPPGSTAAAAAAGAAAILGGYAGAAGGMQPAVSLQHQQRGGNRGFPASGGGSFGQPHEGAPGS